MEALNARSQHSLMRGQTERLRRQLGGWRGFIVFGVLVLSLGLALNWSWLVAIGLAPVVLGVLPCAVMCVLGLCMNRLIFGQETVKRSEELTELPGKSSVSEQTAKSTCCSTPPSIGSASISDPNKP
jgi:hypothetical protein